MLIAIDGPAASGKGTLAKRLARHLGRPHLDTGLLYRAVAHRLLAANRPLTSEAEAARAAQSLDLAHLDEAALRGRLMGDAASIVSAFPAVRAALLSYQRRFAAQEGGAVLDGRDIGTVVAPEAPIKLFVTASPEERARRRHAELLARGEAAALADVCDDIRRRDERDASRSAAPLKAAADAVLIDTTALDPDAAFAAARAIVDAYAQARQGALQHRGKLPD